MSTVSYTIRSLSWSETKPNTEIHPGRPPNLKIDLLILECLEDDPTLSCREIAKIIRVDYASVRYVLINRLHYKCYNLKWIPHFLNDQIYENCVEYSKQVV